MINFWDYWDSFIRNYLQSLPSTICVNGWPVPLGNYGNQNPSKDYLPEPYWGWTPDNDSELKAVFLNLNPGEGGNYQMPNSNSAYIKQAHISYRSMVKTYSMQPTYATTAWFQRKRADWLSDLFPNKFPNTKVSEILCADLIPWHTPSYNAQTASYTASVKSQIITNVIAPLCQISSQALLKNVIIGKGAHIEIILAGLFGQPKIFYECSNSKRRVSVFKSGSVCFIIYVGGQGMSLPKASILFSSSPGNQGISINQIISNCDDKILV